MTPAEMDAIEREDFAKGKKLFDEVSDRFPKAAELIKQWMALNSKPNIKLSYFLWFLKTMGFELEVKSPTVVRIHLGILGKKGMLGFTSKGIEDAYKIAMEYIHRMIKAERTDIEFSEGFLNITFQY